MKINPIEITIHLDPKHSPSEVWDYITNKAFGSRFHPLYISRFNESQEPFENEVLDEVAHATTLRKPVNRTYGVEELTSSTRGLSGSYDIHTSKGRQQLPKALTKLDIS